MYETSLIQQYLQYHHTECGDRESRSASGIAIVLLRPQARSRRSGEDVCLDLWQYFTVVLHGISCSFLCVTPAYGT